ncbi:MAG TPA: tannase/feruloyl esterase family alpha/beta hydrolase [Bryobacteraceae bacterium]|jgi:feruloyl esterase|nr:tannase/feruloyl esterase family alpha/beta hydrolase [Bryobacteraceae bacterium]
MTSLRSSAAGALAVGFALTALLAPAQAATCESLTSLSLPDTTITLAQPVAAGAFTAPATGRGRGRGGDPNAVFKELPAFCRVAGTIKPTSDSDIRFEVWMPASASWNGKFEGNGNGGWTGSIAPATLAAGVKRGYAAAMTDTGHEGGSASFGAGHPERVTDFGYRSEHEMTVKSKAVIAAYYGNAPKLSYWNGCSSGGRQALKEAQKYPEDFNAIVAGSPAINLTGRAIQSVWIAQANLKDEASRIPAAKFPAIHAAALEACDAADGVKDGIIEDPTRCHFDPKTIECKGDDAPSCLTTAQVETARRIYSDVSNPRTKREIFPGHEPGSELGWNTMAGPQPFSVGTDLFKYIIFNNPSWDYKTFNFDSDFAASQKTDEAMDALDPDIKAFLARGGKIIQYHGWADPQISPRSSVEYYNSVLEKLGDAAKVNDSYRLFMVPGMAHCGGGEGTSTFDMLTTLEQWVEAKKAPDQILASRTTRDGKVNRTRPLCPYPQVAKYKGSGSIDDAANFSCKLP